MKKKIYIILLLSLILVACSSDEKPDDSGSDNVKIELSFQINNFVKGTLKSATDLGADNEQKVENLYVFLFPTTSLQTMKSYYISTPTFTGGSWNSTDKKVSLNLTQAEAGSRDVYIVANCSSALKTLLDEVSTITNLQSVLQTNSTPWSATLTTPIMMSGNMTHDFNSNYQLSSIPLIRAIAKVQLNITLSANHQGTPLSSEGTAQYKYKFIDFDKNTYVLKQSSKTDALVSSSAWVNWNDAVTSYTLDGSGNVTNLTLTTYLNERDNSGTAIELSLPYFDGGLLPPPEFGDETYKSQLPAKIERNHWYVIDVEI